MYFFNTSIGAPPTEQNTQYSIMHFFAMRIDLTQGGVALVDG
jgi:hypothetical protein